MNVADAKPDELYKALDWLQKRQQVIEKKLARRHLDENGLVLYDVSSSFYYGHNCPLAKYGHSRDGKKGQPIIVYGLLAAADGRPLAVDVYPGNTGDAKTVPDQVIKIRVQFGLKRIVLVGDRGMLTDTQINHVRLQRGMGWISALRSKSISKLIQKGTLERSLFDDVNLAEIHCPDYPGERLVACYNPQLEERRRNKRAALPAKTEETLAKLQRAVERRHKKPMLRDEIGLKAGRVLHRWKMGKHFRLTIGDGQFAWTKRLEAIAEEENLDGIYVIRTSEKKRTMSAEDSVRHYKRLTQVERAFRSLKGLDLMVRPIYHWVKPRVKAHILLCMLAYYVEWEMRRAWAPLLFADEEVNVDREERDPVNRAEPSESAQEKKKSKKNANGQKVHSFRTLLTDLGSRCRVKFQVTAGEVPATFEQVAALTELQAEAMRLLGLEGQ